MCTQNLLKKLCLNLFLTSALYKLLAYSLTYNTWSSSFYHVHYPTQHSQQQLPTMPSGKLAVLAPVMYTISSSSLEKTKV